MRKALLIFFAAVWLWGAWVKEGAPTKELDDLIDTIDEDIALFCKERTGINHLKAASLELFAYPTKKVAQEVNSSAAEVAHSYALLKSRGCIDPKSVMGEEEMLFAEPPAHPHIYSHPVIAGLERALRRYVKLAKMGGWEMVPYSGVMHPGRAYPEIPALKRRLAMEGYYAQEAVDANTTYAPDLAAAVREFQRRHGLAPDGVVGPATVKALNEPVERKIAKILLNIERFRWIAEDDPYFVLVNIPGYFLEVWEEGKSTFRTRTIVGRKKRPTPIMRHAIAYAVLNPYWRAPKTIVAEDILPRLQNGEFERLRKKGIIAAKDYMGKKEVPLEEVNLSKCDDIERIPYIFMQKPGPQNFLGRADQVYLSKRV